MRLDDKTEIVRASDGNTRRSALLEGRSLASIIAWLQSFKRNALAMAGLRHLVPSINHADRADDDCVIKAVACELASGGLVAKEVLPPIAFGKQVSAEFKQKVISIAGALGTDPNYLMGVIAFETGESFSPSVLNKAGSGAVGLIQFMPSTATHLGTSIDSLKKMKAVEQLDYVKSYLMPYKNKLATIEDLYMAVLWPAGVGKPTDYVLFQKGTKAYTQNSGLDANRDGKVTKREAAARVRAELQKGRGPNYLG